MSDTPALSITNLQVELRNSVVLEDINLQLEHLGFLGLIGPNGAGKTILLKAILGLVTPAHGTIKVYGKTPKEARGLIGYVPQYAHFDNRFPINVREAVLMGRLAKSPGIGGYKERDVEVVFELFEKLELHELSERQIGKLSGGQLQRVLIARALALEPRILLLDEPTASLDSRIGKSVYELLESLATQMTIILVSHDIGVMARHVKTIACLNRKLHYHHSKELTSDMIEEAYGCPVDLLAHGHAHRVLGSHKHEHGE